MIDDPSRGGKWDEAPEQERRLSRHLLNEN